MKNVVIVAPYLGETMIACLKAFCSLSNVKLGIISHQAESHYPTWLLQRIHGHYKVSNALDSTQLIVATKAFQKEWGKVDRLIGYLEHLQTSLAETRSALNIEGMKQEVVANFRDKNQMKSLLQEHQLPVAQQAKIHSLQEAENFIKKVGYPIILKPLSGVGSKNTMRINHPAALLSACNQLFPSPQNPIQAEEFVQGEEHTLEAVVINGKTVWQSSTYYLPGPLSVLENPWQQYCVLLPKEQQQPHVKAFQKTNAMALHTLGLENGLSHMEWFLTADGRAIISEVGARPPGVNIMHLMAFAHDVNIWSHWADLMVNYQWKLPQRKYATACIFLRYQGTGNTIQKIIGWDTIQQALGDRIVLHNLPKIGQGRSTHYEGDGWVIIKSTRTEQVISDMRTILQTVHIR